MSDDSKNTYSNKSEHTNPELKHFLDKSSDVKLPEFRSSKEEIWSKIDQNTSVSPSLYYWTAAAVVILLALGYYLIPESSGVMISHKTQVAENQDIELPDGSLVSLNARSELTYLQDWNTRELSLNGEAFFEVKEGEKFKVNTPLGSVEVLGTSFNVRTHSDEFMTDCKTGMVKVTLVDYNFSEVIMPGERVILDSNMVRKISVNPDRIGIWQNGEYFFNDRPAQEVFNELERQFDIELYVNDLNDLRYTGYFNNKDLPTALKMICEPLDLTYSIVAKRRVEIRSR